MIRKQIMNNEEGAVLIVALMMLVVLSFLGFSASTTSQIETKIAGNERFYKQDLYFSDGAAMEGAQIMSDFAGDLRTAPFAGQWLHALGTLTEANIRDIDNTWWNAGSNSQVSIVDPDSRFMALSMGIARGSSLSAGSPSIHQYRLYGRRRPANQGRFCTVEVGFRKAFGAF
jgi:hypothetical protein